MCDEVKQILYANLKNTKLLLGIKFGSLGQEEKIKGRLKFYFQLRVGKKSQSVFP